MNSELRDKISAWSALGLASVVFLWLWGEAPWVAAWPVLSALAAVVAAVVVWTDVVPGKPGDALWALGGGLVITTELVLEYLLLPLTAWPGQLVAWTLVLAACGMAAFRQRESAGWRTGLRVGLGAAFVALMGNSVVFGLWMGRSVQATVLEAQGAVARFESSQSTDFLSWAVATHWSDLAVLLALGAALGAAVGWAVGLRRRA